MLKTCVICLFVLVSTFLYLLKGVIFLYSDDSLRTGHESLIDKYHKIERELRKSSFANLFLIESSVSKKASYVDIYGTINYPFDIVQDAFLVTTNWYEILLPHINVRACTYKNMRAI